MIGYKAFHIVLVISAAMLISSTFTLCSGTNEKAKKIDKVILIDTIVLPQKLDTLRGPAATDTVQGPDSIRHKKKLALIREKKYKVILIGNSIIHTLGEFGGKYESLKNVWVKHFSKRAALNLGYSGYRTENIIWNLQHGELDFKESPSLFVLLIGTNNTDERRFKFIHSPEEIYQGTAAIVRMIHDRHPSSKIIVIRIFPRGGDKEKGIGKGIFYSSDSCIKRANEAGLLTKQLANDSTIFWADLNKVFLTPEGKINTRLMPDLLHPNEAGAAAWMKELEPLIKRLLK